MCTNFLTTKMTSPLYKKTTLLTFNPLDMPIILNSKQEMFLNKILTFKGFRRRHSFLTFKKKERCQRNISINLSIKDNRAWSNLLCSRTMYQLPVSTHPSFRINVLLLTLINFINLAQQNQSANTVQL